MKIPYSPELEKLVLGSVLVSEFEEDGTNKNFIMLNDVLPNPDYFYVEANKYVYNTMIQLSEAKIKIDIKTVAQKLDVQKEKYTGENLLNHIGGSIYLSSLSDDIPSTVNFIDYAEPIKENYLRRKAIEINYKKIKELQENYNISAIDIITKLNEEENELVQLKFETKIWNEMDMLEVVQNKIDQIQKRENIFINTGLKNINACNILKRGQFILIGALPGVGKSAMLIQLAINMSKIYPDEVQVIISAEMTVEGDIAWRVFCCKNKITDRGMHYNKNEIKNMMFSLDDNIENGNDNILVTDQVNSIDKLLTLVKYLKIRFKAKGKKFGNLFIDFFQAFDENKKSGTTNDFLYNVAKKMNNLKKPNELDCNIWLGSQLWQKDIEIKGLREPRGSDIRNCPSAFDWFDKVIFLHWQNYLDEDRRTEIERIVKVLFAKGRNWRIGKSQLLNYNTAKHNFDDIIQKEEQ